MYYRVAVQRQGDHLDQLPRWQWKSTVLSSLQSLFQWLRLYRGLPQDQLRVFTSSSREGLEEQLVQENKGLLSPSVTAAQFLSERMIHPPTQVQRTAEREGGTSLGMVSRAVLSQEPCNERGRGGSALASGSALERRREELEHGPGGDHDVPYSFVLPPSMPQVLAWMRLLASRERGELPS